MVGSDIGNDLDGLSYAAARRAVIRANHPDVGGSPEQLTAELDKLERRYRKPTTEILRPRLTRRIARSARTIRTRLPRKFPGSKRYFSI